MSELAIQRVSYKELSEFKYKSFDDPYEIVAFMTDHLRETMLACPNNEDKSKTALYIATDGNVAVGRLLQFGTKLKADGEIFSAQTSGSTYVEEKYRPLGVGASLMFASKKSDEYDFKINSLFSTMVVPMLRRLKYVIFEIPQYGILRDLTPMFASVGLKGIPLNVCGTIANLPIRLMDVINKTKRRKLLKKFVVRKVTEVPEWAGEIASNDSHKYMELHDKKWLQWNLDYNMNGYPDDKQSFYTITDKSGKPVGFFMTKERFEEKAGRYHNIMRGTIVEWGTVDSDVLSEADINLLALYSFSPKIFLVLTVTTETKTAKMLKKMGFLRHGILQMAIYDKKKKYDDIGNINLWRIRYGSCNTIIYGQTPHQIS